MHGRADFLIARAAAYVGLQPGFYRVIVGAGVVHQQGVAYHDEPGRAEAALRAMAVDQRLLHWIERPVATEAFDRDNVRAVKLEEELDAGIDGLIVEFSS